MLFGPIARREAVPDPPSSPAFRDITLEEHIELAARLRPKLEAIPGFLENDRYASERTEGVGEGPDPLAGPR